MNRLTSLVSFALASMITLLVRVIDGVVVGEGQGTSLALFLECFHFLA